MIPRIAIKRHLDHSLAIRHPVFSEAEKARKARRTIADALAAFSAADGVLPAKPGRIKIARLKLPTGETVGIPRIEFEAAERSHHVWLDTAAKFRARRIGSSGYRLFDLSQLEGAEVAIDGRVTTPNGTALIAVETVPAKLGYHLTKTEYKIIDLALEFVGKKSECYRGLWDGVPAKFQKKLPKLRALDFDKLASIELPALVDLAPPIQRKLRVSAQKVADALRKAGMRVPIKRPRRKKTATISP